MIACVRIPFFAATVERRENPLLANLPLLIHDHVRVWAVSRETVERQISPGMPLQQAQDLCPQACLIPARPIHYQQTANKLLTVLANFSGLVELEQTQPALLSYLELGRLGNLEEAAKELGRTIRQRTGLTPALGLASGKFTTQMAAASTLPGRALVLPPERELSFLAPLPIQHLPLDEALARRFDQLGLRTLGQFAALPLGATLAQFGARSRSLHELARGNDARPVLNFSPPLEEQITRHFEEAIIDRLLLQANGRAIAAELASRLQAIGQVGRRLRLCLNLEDGGEWVKELHLPQPTGAAERLAEITNSLLDRVQVRCGIAAMTVTMTDLSASYGYQLDLFVHQTGQEHYLRDLLPNLLARFSPGSFFQPTMINPLAYLPEQRFQLQSLGSL
jgi:nucleotidyltransferase/DNA polymerase involved in DNA repair